MPSPVIVLMHGATILKNLLKPVSELFAKAFGVGTVFLGMTLQRRKVQSILHVSLFREKSMLLRTSIVTAVWLTQAPPVMNTLSRLQAPFARPRTLSLKQSSAEQV